MKTKILSSVLIILTITTISCSKTDFIQPTPQTLSKPVLEVKNQTNSEVQNLMYNGLTSTEMTTLWVDHLNYCLNTLTLTSGQVSSINQGIALLNGGLFDNPNTNDYDIWVASTILEFPDLKQQYLVFGQVSQFTNQDFFDSNPINWAPVGSGDENDQDKCHCSRLAGHDFCGTANDSGIWGSTLYRCEQPTCVKKRGCGWFWLKECNGKCSGTTIVNPIFD